MIVVAKKNSTANAPAKGGRTSWTRKPRARQRQRRAGDAMQPFEPAVPNLREDFGLTRKTLSRLTGLSERTLASWESGNKLNEANERALTTADRLLKALAEVVRKDAIAPWLEMPNDAFGGLKPVEVMERGESDRLWRMIYQLGSGSAS
jgi:DNA-binding transcriptional regulator YiaG